MGSTPLSDKEAILTFEDKRYELKTLPKEVQELIKGMQVADAQLRMHEDTLKVLAVVEVVINLCNCAALLRTCLVSLTLTNF